MPLNTHKTFSQGRSEGSHEGLPQPKNTCRSASTQFGRPHSSGLREDEGLHRRQGGGRESHCKKTYWRQGFEILELSSNKALKALHLIVASETRQDFFSV